MGIVKTLSEVVGNPFQHRNHKRPRLPSQGVEIFTEWDTTVDDEWGPGYVLMEFVNTINRIKIKLQNILTRISYDNAVNSLAA